MSKVENYQHVTVLLHEAVDALAIREDGIYVDGTFGRGGHSRLILSRLGEQGRLVVFDKDPEAIAVANELAAQDKRVRVVHNGFETFQTALDELGIDKIDGALFDLGISSPQIDDGSRGFSFRFDAPLDMRMDPTRGMSAAEWIATASEQDLHEVITLFLATLELIKTQEILLIQKESFGDIYLMKKNEENQVEQSQA